MEESNIIYYIILPIIIHIFIHHIIYIIIYLTGYINSIKACIYHVYMDLVLYLYFITKYYKTYNTYL
jgi:hypothetical protein